MEKRGTDCLSYQCVRTDTWYRKNHTIEIPSKQCPENVRYCSYGGLFVSTDGGENWTVTGTDNLSRNNCASICIDHTNDQILYLGSGDPNYYSTYNGVYKSTNGGTTWTASNSGIGNRMAVDLLMSPSDRKVLIAATNDGIWKTTDAGASGALKKVEVQLLK